MGKRIPKGKRDLRRRPPTRIEPDRVLIITEGSKTEPAYFRMLIGELGLTTAKVQIVGDGGSAPISVVEEARRRLKRDSDFEQVYCVFDRDRHETYDGALAAVEALSNSKGLKSKTVLAITSVPCFEIWYLLHVSDSRKPYESATTVGSPADALIKDLKCADACFKEYGKAKCDEFFDIIAPMRSDAQARADSFLKQAADEGAQPFHENPSTRVQLVVKALTEIATKQKPE